MLHLALSCRLFAPAALWWVAATHGAQGQDPADVWRTGHFTVGELSQSAVSGDAADPDGDGFTNLLEYALGGHPRQPEPFPLEPRASLNDGYLSLGFVKPKIRDDLTYRVEVSSDLLSWSAGTAHTAPPVIFDNGDGTETVRVSDLTPATSGRRFMRLQVLRWRTDADADGAPDWDETHYYGTDPTKLDTDGDGLPDGWELAQGFNPLLAVDGGQDPDGDSFSNLQEWQQGKDPHDYFNGVTHYLGVLSGSSQNSDPGAFAPQPLTIRVYGANYQSLVNAPVVFNVTQGGGALALTNSPSAPLFTTLNLRSGADGTVSVYFKQPPLPAVSRIVAATNSYQVQLTAISTLDRDQDGLSDADEDALGTNPNDPDTDADGMPDGYEVANGFAPVEARDALEDADGDRYPNAVEYAHGTKALVAGLASDPQNPQANPPVTLQVDPGGGGTHTTIQAAIDAAAISGYRDWAIVKVKAGIYPERLDFYGGKVLVLGQNDAGVARATLLGNAALGPYGVNLTYGECVLDSLVVTSRVGDETGGVKVGYHTKLRLVSCILRRNRASQGGALNVEYLGEASLAHCTLTGNSASQSGNSVFAYSGIVRLENSILWNPTGLAPEEIAAESGSTVTVGRNVIRNGAGHGANTLTSNPLLTAAGELNLGSPAIDAGVAGLKAALVDFHHERRDSDAAPDLGADERRDADGDGLPDWLEARGVVDPAADHDNDGTNNLAEYRQGSDPTSADSDGDGLSDSAEVAAGTNPQDPDSDGDRMTDGYEVTHSLNPLADDGFEDLDGDRYPNVWEWRHGTRVDVYGFDPDPAAAPGVRPPMLLVDPAGGGTHVSFQDAVNEATYGRYDVVTGQFIRGIDYAIVRVKGGLYEEAVYFSGLKVLILGEASAATGPVVIRAPETFHDDGAYAALSLSGDSVLDGLVISHAPGDYGRGVYVQGGRSRLVNCVIRNNTDHYGAAIYNAGNLSLVHCTLMGNAANYAANAIYNGGAQVTLRHCILWNPGGASIQEIESDDGSVNATGCIIRTGAWGSGNTNVDPLLTVLGHLTAASPARHAAVLWGVRTDLEGERRDVDAGPDVGADEFADADGDALPNWWEAKRFGAASSPRTGTEDSDNDGLSNSAEYAADTNPLNADTDGDGLGDYAEVITHHSNPHAADSDGDGLSDGVEVNQHATDPNLTDSDADGLPDLYEVQSGLNPLVNDAAADRDNDGLTNLREFQIGTAVNGADTDGDGLSDGAEVNLHHSSPLKTDTDGDGLSDHAEVTVHGTNPARFDTDGDLIPDGIELITPGLNPLQANSLNEDMDGDGLSTFQEMVYNTAPHLEDTDGDGVSDGAEVAVGAIPVDPNDYPPSPGGGSGGSTQSTSGGGTNNSSSSNTYIPADITSVALTVGDHSGSHSERYQIDVVRNRGGLKILSHIASDFGVVETAPYGLFRAGESYTITVIHLGTDPELGLGQPDYDYTARVGLPGGFHAEIDDPDGIQGQHDEGDEFYAAGKYVQLDIYKVTITPTSAPFDLWWFGGEKPANYEIQETLQATISPTPTVAGAFNWTIDSGGAFDLALDPTSPDKSKVIIKSKGKSIARNDCVLTATHSISPLAKKSVSFTTMAPASLDSSLFFDAPIDEPGPPRIVGFQSTYILGPKDQFGVILPRDVEINEKVTNWVSDFNGETWLDATGSDHWMTVNLSFEDNYFYKTPFGSATVPQPAFPGQAGSGTKVHHADQEYRAGSLTSGKGLLVRKNKIQFYRGMARQE